MRAVDGRQSGEDDPEGRPGADVLGAVRRARSALDAAVRGLVGDLRPQARMLAERDAHDAQRALDAAITAVVRSSSRLTDGQIADAGGTDDAHVAELRRRDRTVAREVDRP